MKKNTRNVDNHDLGSYVCSPGVGNCGGVRAAELSPCLSRRTRQVSAQWRRRTLPASIPTLHQTLQRKLRKQEEASLIRRSLIHYWASLRRTSRSSRITLFATARSA